MFPPCGPKVCWRFMFDTSVMPPRRPELGQQLQNDVQIILENTVHQVLKVNRETSKPSRRPFTHLKSAFQLWKDSGNTCI
mmetsp:Transcript_71599/g.155828  ORF Transcript_71599/g.155828 Transcript_71599/m.155828 type:complete len:80 (-) Transcript_71599:57-296(-)